MPAFYRRYRRSYSRRKPYSYRRKYVVRRRYSRYGRRPSTYRKRSMTKVKRPRIRTSNYMGDTATVRFRNEIQVNQKQLAAAYATEYAVPGNYLPDVDIPTLNEYRTLYATARVIRSTLKVTFTNIEATYSKSVGVSQLPLNDATLPTATPTVYYSEQPRTKSAYLTPLSGSKSNVTLLVSGTTKTAFGNITPSTSQSDQIATSAMTTAPTDQWNWSVWTQNVSGAGTLETAGTNIRIIQYYTIQFFNRQQQTN